jgi:hypothetical protein
VSGVVRGAAAGTILVDDGTGIAHVALRGAAAAMARTVSAGDALRAAGTTERDAAGSVAVVVDDPASIVRAGAPGGARDGATRYADGSAGAVVAVVAGGDPYDPAGVAYGAATGAATGAGVDGDPSSAVASTGIAAAPGGIVDPSTDGSPAAPDLLPILLAVVAGCVGAAAAAFARRRRAAVLDPAVARRLAELSAGPAALARGGAGGGPFECGSPHLDAVLGTSLSSRPTGAGQARSI